MTTIRPRVYTGQPRRSGVSRLIAIGATVAAFGALRLIFNLVGVRAVGIDAVGRTNLALSWCMLVALPMSAGIAPMIARFAALDTDAGRGTGLLRFGVRVGAVWFGAALLLGAIAIASQGPQIPRPSIVLSLGWALGYSAAAIVRAWLFARARLLWSVTLEGLSGSSFLVALILVSGSPSLAWLPFTAYFVPSVLALVALLLRPGHLRPAEIAQAELRSYAGFALLGSVVSLGIASGLTLVSARGGLGDVAIWATLSSLVAPVLLAPRTLSTAMLPRLSRTLVTDQQRFLDGARLHRDLSSYVALLVIGPLALVGPELVALALRDSGIAGPPGTWWCLIVAAWGTLRGEPIITATSAQGKTRACAIGSAAAGVIAVVAWLGSRSFGLTGIAASYALFTLATPFLISWFASRTVRLGDLGSRLVPTDGLVVLGLAAGAPYFELPTTFRAICALMLCALAASALLRVRPAANRFFAETSSPA